MPALQDLGFFQEQPDGLDDQVSVEVYYRIQLWEELALTPDVQYIRNPAINPEASSLLVVGLRSRFAF